MRKSTILILAALFACCIFSSGAFGQGRERRFPVAAGQTQSQFSLGMEATETRGQGMVVTSIVSGGTAEVSGVRVGDVVVKLAGVNIKTKEDFIKAQILSFRMHAASQGLTIEVVRDGQRLTLDLKDGVSGGTAAAAQPSGPWLGVAFGAPPSELGAEGAMIKDLIRYSPADQAGLMNGDVVTALNGNPVKSVDDARKAVSGLTIGRSCKIAITRLGMAVGLDIVPIEPPAADSGMNKKKGIAAEINVLKYAMIDPRTRTVTLVGKYDPTYNTGSIPYYDLLMDAVNSPYPSFTLEPTDATRNGVSQVHAAISADVQRMSTDPQYPNVFAMRMMDLILNNPDMAKDKKQFVTKGAAAFGVTDDEMLKLLKKSAGDNSVTSEELMPVIGKVMVGLGYTNLGEALQIQNDAFAVFDKLGIGSEGRAIADQFHAGALSQDQASVQLTVLMVSAMLREMRVPENEIQSRANKVYSGRLSAAEFQKYMEDTFMSIVTDSVGLKMFNGLTLSHQFLCRLYNVPTPMMNLVFKDVPADSVLGDVLFRADYALKSIITSPDIKEKIPGFMTEMEYIDNETNKGGVRIPGDAGAEVGHRLIPGDVKLSVSPDGNIVSFDDARVKIIGWVINQVGSRNSADVQQAITNYTNEYADYLTRNYDQLAKVFPPLHKIREASKLIALVRWARSNNYSLTVENASGAKVNQASTAVGFWQGVFTANQQEFSLTIVTEGGASFDQSEGDAWVQPKQDVVVTDNVLKQLAASEQFAREAVGAGSIEEARDLAQKSALAMSGEIDLSTLPQLDVPLPDDPFRAAAINNDSVNVIDQNLEAISNAKIIAEKADMMESSSPQDAAALKQLAEQQQKQAQKNLDDLKQALDEVRQYPGRSSDVAVQIHSMTAWPMAPAKIPVGSGSTMTTTPSPEPGGETPPAEDTSNKKKSKTRAELQAELAKLQSELDATKQQLMKLNYNIAQNQKLFADWGDEAEKGMEKARDVFFNLFMDASAGKLLERYDQMYELSKKLPDQPAPLIKRLGNTKELLTGLSDCKSFKDVMDWAYAEGDTLPQVIDKLRDGIDMISSLKGWDKTLVGAAWHYGSNMVDMAYLFAQYNASYDNLELATKNNEDFNKALAALKQRMNDLYDKSKDVQQQLDSMSDEDLQ